MEVAASQLSVTDRLRLIDELALSAPDDQPPTLSTGWLEEIERRSAEIDDGTVATESWDNLRRRLFAKHGVEGASRCTLRSLIRAFFSVFFACGETLSVVSAKKNARG